MDDFRVVHSSVAGISETCGLIVSVPFCAAVYHSFEAVTALAIECGIP